MLTALAIAAVLVAPLLVIAGLAQVVEARRRAQARVIARQIMLTDAVHAELGAVVAPIVEKHVFRPWRVVFPLRQSRGVDVSRLVAIADRVLGDQRATHDDIHIVFTRSAPAVRSRAA